jgi:histidine ammonia-lyase
MESNEVVYLDGQTLTLPLLDAIVRLPRSIDLSKESWRMVERSR